MIRVLVWWVLAACALGAGWVLACELAQIPRRALTRARMGEVTVQAAQLATRRGPAGPEDQPVVMALIAARASELAEQRRGQP